MKTPRDPDQATEQWNEQPQLLERQAANSDVRIVGPIAVGPNTYVVKLVRGGETLGELSFWPATGTVVDVEPHKGPVHDILVAEARAHGLLHDKDIPDHLQHDQEQL